MAPPRPTACRISPYRKRSTARRQIHTLAAYWALVIVAVHLGLRWPMIMGVARNLVGISTPNAIRGWALRLIAAAIAVHGVWSSFELGLGSKLAMQVTLDWWNFEESVIGFFVHCIAIAGLYMFLTYYTMKWIQGRKRKNLRAADTAYVDVRSARRREPHQFPR